MLFNLAIACLVIMFQIRYLKDLIDIDQLIRRNILILVVLILVGFMYLELFVIMPLVTIVYYIGRSKHCSRQLLSFIMSTCLIMLVVYCQFFNGLLLTKKSEFEAIHGGAIRHHEFFPMRVGYSPSDGYTIHSLELAADWGWGVDLFKREVSLSGNDVVYARHKCGFGEMCSNDYYYGTDTPANYP